MKDFVPMIVYLRPFKFSVDQEAYVSLRMLSRNWVGGEDFQNISQMQYTRLIRYGLNLFLEKMKTGDLNLRETYFMHLLDLDYNFFFNMPDDLESGLQLSSHLFDTHAYVQKLIQKTGFSQIPTTTRDRFLSSCIKISKKQK